jgi:outer membrane lipoprotein SlyB
MGALAGGAAGYYGGNRVGSGHGIIGALAGAFAGSKLEDKYKEGHHHHQNNNGRW